VIPRSNVTAWRNVAPWADDAQVEQDLVLSRALVELFSDPRLAGSFALRGGTALHKAALAGPVRYSEDIDLVQVLPGPVKTLFDVLHDRVDPWLGKHNYEHRGHSIRAVWRFQTETVPVQPMRLKIEANTREHFALLGIREVSISVDNPWFCGSASISTFALDELLGTKLRALYQRKKGRDLFDLYEVGRRVDVKLDQVVEVFREYVRREGLAIGRKEFEANLEAKVADLHFRRDVTPLLAPGISFDIDAAVAWVRNELLPRFGER